MQIGHAPRLEIEDEKLPVHSRHQNFCTEAYGDVLGAAHSFSPINVTSKRRLYSAHEWYTEGCAFAVLKSLPFAMRRDKHHIQDFEHLILVSRLLEGRTRGTTGDDIIDRRPGPIYVSDQGRPFEAIVGHNLLQCVMIPKAALGLEPNRPSIPPIIYRTCTAGKLVHAGMDKLFDTLWQNDKFISAALLNRFIACLKIAMGAPPQRGDVRNHARDALSDLIAQYIEQRLGDYALSAEQVSAEFGVSRSSLYRMFEDKGGLRNYITERRAVRAILEISEAPHAHGRIRMSAERWGFLAPPTFDRTVHRICGGSPGTLFAGKSAGVRRLQTAPRLLSRFASRTALAA